MNTIILQILRSRWLAWGLHASLWLLLYLAFMGLDGESPTLQESSAFSGPPQPWVPVANASALFSPAPWPKSLVATNVSNLFFTTTFVKPPPPPPPPPPTTRKILVGYQGYFQAPDGLKMVMVVVETNSFLARVGAPVVTNHFISDAVLLSMTLTNAAGQTNVIALNTKKEIDIPIK